MSASSFLGFAGLTFLFGVDAFVGLMAAIIAFVPVLFFLAERMRNSGKFTLADVLSFRLRERPARLVAAVGTLSVVIIYLLAQMVGAGALIQALTGITFTPAVIIVGGFMLAYVIFGGMLATTWVQIIKARLLMTAGVALAMLRGGEGGLQPDRAVQPRGARTTRRALDYLKPGLQFDSGLALLSFGIAFVFGTAGLPHILMRFFTVPERQGGARLDRLGRVPDRGLLPDRHVRRRRRAGDPDADRGQGGGRDRQPRDPRAGRSTSAAARARRAATSSWPSSPRSRWRRSSRSSRGS